jgi:hypothetical protein
MKPPKPSKQPPITEEMKAWSTALASETAGWPHISQRPFFGFTALYRGEKIFGMLPRSCNLEAANKIAFKIERISPKNQKSLANDERITSFQMSKNRSPAPWFTFLLSSGSDLHGALEWLSISYEAAGKRTKK